MNDIFIYLCIKGCYEAQYAIRSYTTPAMIGAVLLCPLPPRNPALLSFFSTNPLLGLF